MSDPFVSGQPAGFEKVSGTTNPVDVRINTGSLSGPLSFPVTGQVSGEVVGFTAATIPSAEVADRVSAKLQSFYDSLDPEERDLVTTLLVQADELARQQHPQ